jgi:SAM-dependent methyltransferase
VLEYGCGADSMAAHLAHRGAHVTGIDVSPVAIEEAERRASLNGGTQRLSYRVMDAEHLEFEDQSFDLICGGAILHHLDLEQAYGEISRTLRPGGRAVFLEPMGHNPLIRWYRNRTPDYRTVDEHPLLTEDLEAGRRHFGRVSDNYFHLFVLAAVPLRNGRLFSPVRRSLDAVDRFLIRHVPPLRKHAWMVVLEMSDPRFRGRRFEPSRD